MNSLDRTLESFARTEPDENLVQDAQRKLETRLAQASERRPPARRMGGWLAAAASAAAVVASVLWLPLQSTPAFGAVQQHFRDFRTLRFDLEQRMNGEQIIRTRISLLANGSVRTEVGDDVVVIVNTEEKQVLTLLQSAKLGVLSPLTAPIQRDDAMAWLDEVREFQGMARELPGTRIIQGQKARGWELPLDHGNIVVWANEDSVPLEMQIGDDFKMELSFRFEFDPVLPEKLFSTQVPAGYTLQPTED
jgi:hypothetical protein